MKKSHLTILFALCLLYPAISTAQKNADTVQNHKTNIEFVEEVEVEELSFTPVEVLPMFRGSTDRADFEKFIYQMIKYPVVAQENGIQGRVTVKFTIDTDGVVNDAKILKGVDPYLDKEALRVIKSSPKWLPAKQNGMAVPYSIVVSVVFRLQN